MHNLYGNRRLNVLEIKGAFTLSNGMYCEWGESADEGLSVDIYDDKTKALLVGMEHGIYGTGGIKPSSRTLKPFIESFAHELEDSMVYYYGPRECSFELDELTKPVPKKNRAFCESQKKKPEKINNRRPLGRFSFCAVYNFIKLIYKTANTNKKNVL